jgi:coproporphyrinogen III oxidase-like Fe-S oxidoreductase
MLTVKTTAALAGFVTRREGGKFLRLDEPIDEAAITASALEAAGGTSLYIHIPFCRTLCPFCSFNRYLFREDAARRYFVNLRKELDIYIAKGFRFADFYFGGGTPTVLMDELTGFITYLRQKFPVERISLETTPRELTDDNIARLKDAGINRLSIGVQSFDDALVKAMGRQAPPGEEIKERLLKTEGQFQTLNEDFIFNFPGQSLEQLAADVAAFKEMGIDQATFYPLMASPHKREALARKFRRVDTSREKRFYDIILRELYGGGYRASTAWCFSRGDHIIDEYIVDYDDYIGIGAGSVSMVNDNFYVNSFALNSYGALLESGRLPVIRWRRLSESEHRRYYLLSKLFGMEIDGERYRHRFGAPLHRQLWREITFLKVAGAVREEGGRLRVTARGMYPVSVMMRDFFASLNWLREDCIERQI